MLASPESELSKNTHANENIFSKFKKVKFGGKLLS